MPVRWGVLGACGIADRRTIPEGLLASPECELIGVMDLDAQATAALAARYGVPHAVTRVEDLLDLPGLQAVYIASPVHHHLEQVQAAAARGKHVLCEKPLGRTTAEAEQAARACQEHGVLLGVGYMMRFHHLHRELGRMVRRGDLGQVIFGRAQATTWYPEIPGAWRQDPALGGGGALPDMGSHCIDLLEQFLGPVAAVKAYVDTLTFRYAVDDSATLLLKHASGAHGVMDVHFNAPDAAARNALEVYGTRGSAFAHHTIGQGGGEMTAYLPEAAGYDASQRRDAQGGFAVEAEPMNIYQAEVEDFSRCIVSGAAPTVSGEDGIHIHHVMAAAVQSSRDGVEVAIPRAAAAKGEAQPC
jgi:predicted dehydrogenase